MYGNPIYVLIFAFINEFALNKQHNPFPLFRAHCRVYKSEGSEKRFNVPLVQVQTTFSRLSLNPELTHGKNKTLAQIIVEILVYNVMALLFDQRCPRLLEGRVG